MSELFLTRSPLTAFQKKNSISATGKADLKTLNELRKQTSSQSKNNKATAKNKKTPGPKISYDIKTIQLLLKKAGFHKGQIDGKMGPETVKAIKQFQKSNNFKESGVINAKT